MKRFILRRLGFVLLTMWVSSILIFVATQVLPGDVAKMILGRFATEEALFNLRERETQPRPGFAALAEEEKIDRLANGAACVETICRTLEERGARVFPVDTTSDRKDLEACLREHGRQLLHSCIVS